MRVKIHLAIFGFAVLLTSYVILMYIFLQAYSVPEKSTIVRINEMDEATLELLILTLGGACVGSFVISFFSWLLNQRQKPAIRPTIPAKEYDDDEDEYYLYG